MRRALGFGLAGLLLMTGNASAQFRPPPPTEAQTLIQQAESERTEAAKKESTGDKNGASAAYGRALDLYEKALASDPNGNDAPAAAAGLGAAAVARRDYARAIKALQPWLTAHPKSPEVAFPLGVALYKSNKFADALAVFEPLAAADEPQHFIVHYYIASYALAMKDGQKAVEELQRYLARRPKEIAGGDAQIEEMIGRAYLVQKRPMDARSAFERSNRLRPSSAAQLGIASVLELEGKKGEALALVEQLARNDSKNVEVLERLARMYVAAGALGRAADVATQLAQVSRTPSAVLLLADVRAAQKDWKSAEAQYREAQKLAPQAPEPVIGLGRMLSMQGRHADAAAELEKSAVPGDPTLLAALGSAHRRAGHFDKALEAHTRLQKLAPRDAQSFLLLAADQFAAAKWDEAIAAYGTALELDPGSARGRHFLMLALWRRALARDKGGVLPESSLLDLRRALELEASEPLAQAVAAAQLGLLRYGDAEQTLADRATVPSANWLTKTLYGYALLGNQKGKEALAVFDKVAAPDKESAAQGTIDLGWALAKLALDDHEAAAKKLASLKKSSASIQANVPMILTRLAWKRIEEGDAAGASRELAAAGAAPKGTATAQLAELTKALVAVENKSFEAALSGIRGALAEKQPWFEPTARPLFEAYVDYRMGKAVDARKQLAAAQKLLGATKLAFASKLARAIDDREAEVLYTQNLPTALPRIEKLLKVTGADEATEARAQNNLACARYRKGQAAAAVAAWKAIASKLPEAELNLGLHALQQEHDPKGALAHFRKYAASGAARSAQAKEWIERLSQLYGEEADNK